MFHCHNQLLSPTLPKRTIFFETPSDYRSLQQFKDLKGPANKEAYKENGKETEDPNTPEGRNIIRGQSIFFLKRYEHDQSNRRLLRQVDELIQQSLKDELHLPDAEDPVSTVTKLKAALEEMRKIYVKDGAFTESPKHETEDYETPKGRENLIEMGETWLENVKDFRNDEEIKPRYDQIDQLTKFLAALENDPGVIKATAEERKYIYPGLSGKLQKFYTATLDKRTIEELNKYGYQELQEALQDVYVEPGVTPETEQEAEQEAEQDHTAAASGNSGKTASLAEVDKSKN